MVRVFYFCVLEGEHDGQWCDVAGPGLLVYLWSDVGDHGNGEGNGPAVTLAPGLVDSWRVLGRPLLVAVGFGPELLL